MANTMTGIFVPIEILQDQNLSIQEKLILSLVKNMGQLYMTNNSLSELLGISKSRVSHLCTSLKQKGYVSIQLTYNESRQVDKRTITLSKAVEAVKKTIETIKNLGGKNKQLKQQQNVDQEQKTQKDAKEVTQQSYKKPNYYQKRPNYFCFTYTHDWDFDELDRMAEEYLNKRLEEIKSVREERINAENS